MQNWIKVFLFYLLLGLVIYVNSLNNQFLIDDSFFIHNPVSSSVKYIWSQWNPYREEVRGVLDSQQKLGYYRPMAHMFYDLSYAVFKNNLWEYHLVNLILFAFASLLINLLVQRISGNALLAFLTGTFYLIHPVNGIIVNYVSASVFPLEVIFIAGTMLLLGESLERQNSRSLYSLSLVCAFFSLFWNESGIMVPLYVSAFVLWSRPGPLKQKAFYLIPYYLLVLAYLLFRVYFNSITELIFRPMSILHLNAAEYMASLFQVIIWYLSQLFYPRAIVMAWATPIVHDHLLWRFLGMGFLLMAFGLLFVRLSKEKGCQLALIWLLIGFLPVCVAAFRLPENGAQIEPHWFVFSSVGFFILVSRLCIYLGQRFKGVGLMVSLALIFAWGSVSHANNLWWANQETYSLYWSKEVPTIKWIHYYIATAYHGEGNEKESLKHLTMALSGNPTDGILYLCLGVIDFNEGHLKEAEIYDDKALAINPHSSLAYTNLGDIYLQEKKWKKAQSYFHQALAYNPLMLQPRLGLAIIDVDHADYKKAVELCLVNLNITPDDQQTLSLLSDIYLTQKDLWGLKAYVERLISLQTEAQALTRLGIQMAEHHAPDLALDCFTKAIRMAPEDKDGYLALGTFLANGGQYEKAIYIWRLGLRIDPADRRFKNNISRAYEIINSHAKKH